MALTKKILLDGGPLHGHYYYVEEDADRIKIDLLSTNQKAYYKRTSKVVANWAEVYTWIDLNTIQNESNKEGVEPDKA